MKGTLKGEEWWREREKMKSLDEGGKVFRVSERVKKKKKKKRETWIVSCAKIGWREAERKKMPSALFNPLHPDFEDQSKIENQYLKANILLTFIFFYR